MRAKAPLAVLLLPVVLLIRALAPLAVFPRFPLVVLVSGVQVPPMVALDPTQVSVPGAAAAMVAFASAMKKNDAAMKFKLSRVNAKTVAREIQNSTIDVFIVSSACLPWDVELQVHIASAISYFNLNELRIAKHIRRLPRAAFGCETGSEEREKLLAESAQR